MIEEGRWKTLQELGLAFWRKTLGDSAVLCWRTKPAKAFAFVRMLACERISRFLPHREASCSVSRVDRRMWKLCRSVWPSRLSRTGRVVHARRVT